jgi:hypothetical protein
MHVVTVARFTAPEVLEPRACSDPQELGRSCGGGCRRGRVASGDDDSLWRGARGCVRELLYAPSNGITSLPALTASSSRPSAVHGQSGASASPRP